MSQPARARDSSPDWNSPEWAAGIHAGDERVFDTIVRELGPALCAFATRLTRSPERAQDVVHDVFVTIWMTRARSVIQGSVKAYLYRAVRNRALSTRRAESSAHRALGRLIHWRASESEVDSELSEPEARLQRSQLAVAIQRALEQLPPRVRLAFELVREHHLTYAEAAHVMGVTPKAIDVSLTRAGKALREALRGFWP